MASPQLALSVRQPWAWAIIMGYKDVENRSWKTNHRGPLLIHAPRKVAPEGFSFLQRRGIDIPADFARGGLVGSVVLVDCVSKAKSPWAFQDHWHWLLRRPFEFNRPIECTGRLGLFAPDISGQALGAARRYGTRHYRRHR
ncbi:hypothetical protein BH18ACT15_BH18ACT15_15370 [soil metagenome]